MFREDIGFAGDRDLDGDMVRAPLVFWLLPEATNSFPGHCPPR